MFHVKQSQPQKFFASQLAEKRKKMSKKENENVNVNTENANTTELVAQTFNGYGVENVKFHNADLIEHTEKIIQYREVGKKAELGICYELGQVKNGDLYKKAGFKSIGEYGN